MGSECDAIITLCVAIISLCVAIITLNVALFSYHREQRVTNMAVAVMLGISIIAGPVLRV